MLIKAKELIEFGMEVDMPVWNDEGQIIPRTICYDKERKQFVLKVIKTGQIDYAYDKLSDLVRNTNQIYNYDDVAVEDD